MSIEKQAINESLLQSYRSIFISSHSVFLALGGLLLNKNPFLIPVLAIISVLQIWLIWFGVVSSRAKIVDYYKYLIGEKYNTNGEPISIETEMISENDYVKKNKIRSKINLDLHIKTFRETRCKIDIILPLLFSLMWVGLAVYDYLSQDQLSCVCSCCCQQPN